MFNKLSFSLLLIASLSCFGQVVSYGGYATTAGPAVGIIPLSAASAPLIATPDVALPGSGPAVGLPLGNSNTNDSRISTGPSVYNPNSIPDDIAGPIGAANTAAETQTSSSNNAPATDQPFEFGVQHVETSRSAANTAAPSLGEIAKQLRTEQRPATKVINNETVARLNASLGGISNLAPQGSGTVASSTEPANPLSENPPSGQTLMALNQAPAMPQNDQGQAVQPDATAGQQRHASDTSSVSQTSASSQQTSSPTEGSATSANSNPGAKLPQTATHLPLLLLLGGIGVGSGILYLLRR